MARVQLSREEVAQLTSAQTDLLELREQVAAGITAGISTPALADAVEEQITQINSLLDNFQ